MEAFADDFLKKHGGANQQGWWYLRMKNQMEMFANALNQAKSAEPKKVAAALREMKFKNALDAEVFMRPTDHSLFQDMYISSFGSGAQARRGEDRLGLEDGRRRSRRRKP